MISKLQQLEQFFCLCDVVIPQPVEYAPVMCNPYELNEYAIEHNQYAYWPSYQGLSFESENTASSNINPKKKCQLKDMNFIKECQRLESICLNTHPDQMLIQSKLKSNRKTNSSKRRSEYIGVSKNGANWQALISIDKSKKYIGTFKTQLEAAREFDKYSILINNVSAMTNFNYSRDEVLQIVYGYMNEHSAAF